MMKTLFLFLFLAAGPCLAQTTFIVKLPDGKPAKDIAVYYQEKEVAKTNEKGEAKVTAKIAKGETVTFNNGWNYHAEHIAEKNIEKPVTIHITLEELEVLPVQESIEMPKVIEPQKRPTEVKEVQTFVDEPAEFPGGHSAMNAFLAKNLKYPPAALEKEIAGKCYLQFIVDAEGMISDIKVKRGVTDCPECDQEAVRVIGLMPKWTPGKTNGKAVKSYYNLPVKFSLN